MESRQVDLVMRSAEPLDLGRAGVVIEDDWRLENSEMEHKVREGQRIELIAEGEGLCVQPAKEKSWTNLPVSIHSHIHTHTYTQMHFM